uniref:MULE transposase domain-containing protein n=1 Tax=Lactuca sativa TaxID=4236 RepID=A0A9R1UKJ6_LACSA|nr:hypothetical protein LSAT_V11C900467140 [Lactuca sativa]
MLFICCLLSVIFISNAPLRGDYLQTMFIVVAMDGNNQPLPIIFFFVKNIVDSCTWFLMRLKEALRYAKEVSFITNMEDVINYFPR